MTAGRCFDFAWPELINLAAPPRKLAHRRGRFHCRYRTGHAGFIDKLRRRFGGDRAATDRFFRPLRFR